MSNSSLTATFEGLPKIGKVLLILFFGWVICGVYRIAKYLETKNIVTLIVGIIALVTGVGNFVFTVIDLITEITSDKITVLAD